MTDRRLLRILDANFNRSREGLRVCEDVCRFVLDAREPARELKTMRRTLTGILRRSAPQSLLAARDAAADVGKNFDAATPRRSGWSDLYYANAQRSKESLRVLEEILRLSDPPNARRVSRLRFRLYTHEKKIAPKLTALRHLRA